MFIRGVRRLVVAFWNLYSVKKTDFLLMTPEPARRFRRGGTMQNDALGTSEAFLFFQEELTRLADNERPVLIVGERGTGKEWAAQRLHYLSRRWERPLITVLCPGLSSTLLESELFGHEAGAFTGARGRHPGRFELADGGTLFLDEVGDMPLALQDKLLRVIEYGAFERVGGTVTLRPDVRIVAATNKDLPCLAAEGRFRADLLDRLGFEIVHAPPLRLRQGDVVLLATHFAASLAMEHDLSFEAGTTLFGPEALRQLDAYSWPGNVRELKNAVERSLLRCGLLPIPHLILDPFRPPWADAIRSGDEKGGALREPLLAVPPADDKRQETTEEAGGTAFYGLPPRLGNGFRLEEAVQDLERQALDKALREARYRQTEAARLLGLTYHQFRALYRKHKDAPARLRTGVSRGEGRPS